MLPQHAVAARGPPPAAAARCTAAALIRTSAGKGGVHKHVSIGASHRDTGMSAKSALKRKWKTGEGGQVTFN